MAETEKHTKATYAASMKHAVGMLGCTKPELQRIKALGCPAFKAGGHININIARQWLADRPKPADGTQALDREGLLCLKLQRQIAALDFSLEQNQGKFLPADEVRRTWLAHLQQARAVLLACPAELAPALCGLTAPDIELRLVEKMDAALAALRANPLGAAA